MNINGPKFRDTLKALKLSRDQARDAKRNATEIVGAIISAYTASKGGRAGSKAKPRKPATGLVYGRIQSGKTRAMIASTAMAFDNGFRIAVVMTSNINDLVSQTHLDFSTGLPGLMILTKDSDLDRESDNAELHLRIGRGCLLLVCSKGTKSLQNVSRFLRSVHGGRYAAIIFDDEGDQASLDTNTRKRSRAGIKVAPSAINAAIQSKLRLALPRHVYVSVTGTPQAVLLQSADSANRPSFITMLPPGASYIGGDRFFNTDEPDDNPDLIALVDRNEKQQLLSRGAPIPAGLRASLLFFLASAAAAIKNLGLPDQGYSYLCHPSLKNDEQAVAEKRINGFLNEVMKALYGRSGDPQLVREFRAAHARLKTTLGRRSLSFDETKKLLIQHLPTRRLLVINVRVKRQGINYGKGLNFLIGGNTLGRGIAIRDLLVTYYIRDSKVSQIDTMHQHARMYGYRKATLDYTRLFIPKHLYYRFRDIHRSDEDLRDFIEEHKDLPATFPVEYTFNLRTTRPGVLDVNRTDTLSPGMHIFPNYIALPQKLRSYNKVLRLLQKHFELSSIKDLERRGKEGVIIKPSDASALVGPIRTRSKNTWRDATISAVIDKVAGKFRNKVVLRFRTAQRTVGDDGFVSTGTLSGTELRAAQKSSAPTLWIMAATTRPGSAVAAGQKFMYPTLVIPESLRKLFMFNRGA